MAEKTWEVGICEAKYGCEYMSAAICPSFTVHRILMQITGTKIILQAREKIHSTQRRKGCCTACTDCFCSTPLQTGTSCLYLLPPLGVFYAIGYSRMNSSDEDDYELEPVGMCEMACLGCICIAPTTVYLRSLAAAKAGHSEHAESPWYSALVGCCLWPCALVQIEHELDKNVAKLLSSPDPPNSMGY